MYELNGLLLLSHSMRIMRFWMRHPYKEGGQHGEHVGLQENNQQFQQVHEDGKKQGENGNTSAHQWADGTEYKDHGHKHHGNHMTSQHVGK